MFARTDSTAPSFVYSPKIKRPANSKRRPADSHSINPAPEISPVHNGTCRSIQCERDGGISRIESLQNKKADK